MVHRGSHNAMGFAVILGLTAEIVGGSGLQLELEQTLSNIPDGPQNAIVGDVDNDGRNELVVATGQNGEDAGRVLIYEKVKEDYEEVYRGGLSTDNEWGLAIGDVDNDGKNVLVIARGWPNLAGEIEILKYLDGAYTSIWIGAEFWGGRHNLSIGDADNDGENELVVGMDYSGRKWIVLEWTPAGLMKVFETGGSDVISVDVADADNDGENEIIVGAAAWSWYDWRVYEWNGSLYELVWDSPSYGYVIAKARDVNGDGLNEVVVSDDGYGWGDFGIMVFQWTGATYEILWENTVTSFTRSGNFGNMLGGVVPQVAARHLVEPDQRTDSYVEILEWQGDSMESVWRLQVYTGTLPIFGDCDNDGLDELIICDRGHAEGARLYIFGAQVPGDSDGDGLPDNWEVEEGLNPEDSTGENGAGGDPDRDGKSNSEEWRDRSHPRSIEMFVQVQCVDLVWTGIDGVHYQIYQTSDLLNPIWGPVGDPVAAQGGLVRATHLVSDGDVRFFKVEALD